MSKKFLLVTSFFAFIASAVASNKNSALLEDLSQASHRKNKESLETQTINNSPISCLPDELLIQIFQLRGVPKHASPVCKQWERVRHDKAVPLKVKMAPSS